MRTGRVTRYVNYINEFVPSYVIIVVLFLLDNISKGGACYSTHPPSTKSAPVYCFGMRTGRVTRYVNYINEFVPSYVIIVILFLLDNISKGGACYSTHPPSSKSAPACCFGLRTGRVTRYVNYINEFVPSYVIIVILSY